MLELTTPNTWSKFNVVGKLTFFELVAIGQNLIPSKITAFTVHVIIFRAF